MGSLIKQDPNYVKMKLNSAFSVLFYGMIVLCAIALVIVAILSQRKEMGEIEEEEKEAERLKQIEEDAKNGENLLETSKMQECSKATVDKQEKTNLSMLNPANAKEEYLGVLQNPDFNKILVV